LRLPIYLTIVDRAAHTTHGLIGKGSRWRDGWAERESMVILE